MDERTIEEGLCAMCRERPAEVLGLVCDRCKAAVDADEPWTHAHDEVLFRLREAEAELDDPAGPA